MTITVTPFFEASTGSFSYVVSNPESKTCAVIDAALGVDEHTNAINTHTADQILDWVEAHGYVVRWILETHVHADRPSAAGYLKSQFLCAQTAIGAGTPHLSGYDTVLSVGDKICLDHECGRVLATPGHTPGCISYQFGDAVFVGDTLFMPDVGTGRCDFPGGSARTLYASIQTLLALPDETRLYVCHDYGGARRCRFVTTVAEQKQNNVHIGQGAELEQFVSLRSARDETLDPPKWQDVAIPANLACASVEAVQQTFKHLCSGQQRLAN